MGLFILVVIIIVAYFAFGARDAAHDESRRTQQNRERINTSTQAPRQTAQRAHSASQPPQSKTGKKKYNLPSSH